MKTGKKALVIGASGLVGHYVLNLLLQSPDYSEVHVLARSPLVLPDSKSAKLQETILDFHKMRTLSDKIFQVDDVFSCLGTTTRKTLNLEIYRNIEIDYPVMLAEITAEQGAKSFH